MRSVPPTFVDRRAEQTELEAAWLRVVSARWSEVVTVEGPAGIGKSALVERWLHGVRTNAPDVLVLRWSCGPDNPGDPGELSELSELGDLGESGESGGQAAAPLILLAEDLHHAEVRTLSRLTEIARGYDVPCLVVATLRPSPRSCVQAFLGFVERLTDTGRARRLLLPPLGQEAVGALIAEHTGSMPTLGQVRAMTTYSHGNPLYLALTLRADYEPKPGPGVRGLDALAPTLWQRYATPGSPEARAGAWLAARIPYRSWQGVAAEDSPAGMDIRVFRKAVDTLLAEGTLVDAPDGLLFVHPLVRDSFASLLPSQERQHVHLAMAQHLVALNGERRPEQLLRTARALAQRGAPLQPVEVRTLFAAATTSMWVTPAPAAAWFALVIQSPAASEPVRRQARGLQLEAMLFGGETAHAWELCQELCAEDPPETMDSYLLETVLTVAFASGELEAMAAMALGAADLDRNPRVRSSAALALLLLGRTTEALQHYQAALGQAPAATGAHLPMLMSQLLSVAVLFGRDPAEIQELHTRCTELAATSTPVERRTVVASLDLLALHLPEAMGPQPVDRSRYPVTGLGGGQSVNQHIYHLIEGRWDEIVREAPLDLEILRATGNHLAVSMPAICLAGVYAERGATDQAREYLEQTRQPLDAFHAPLAAVAQARIAQVDGDLDTAIEFLDQAYALGQESGVCTWHTVVAESLVDILLATGRESEAIEVAHRAMELVRPLGIPLLTAYGMLAVAQATDQQTAAKAALEAAGRARSPWVQALSHVRLAACDVSPRHHLLTAHGHFLRMGAAVRLEHCENLMAQHGVAVPSVAGSGLSALESEIVRAVVEGSTNREIAANLHYSVKTIEMHLSRIYTQTGRSGRVELVRAVSSGELVLDLPTPRAQAPSR